jgi:uncharacterized protein (TIGR02099 family)
VISFTTKLIRKLAYLLAALIIFAALLVSIMRLLTPVLNEHRAQFEKLASRLLEMPVIIHSVEVRWHGYSPEIVLSNVTVMDPDTQKPKLNLALLEIDFSIWRTLLERQVFVRSMTIAGMKLNITQVESGEVQIGDFAALNIKDSMTGSAVKTDSTFAWIFSQPLLAMENIDITYSYSNAPDRSILIDSLSLSNKANHHIVNGQAILRQDLPVKMNLHLAWDGDVRKMKEAKGHFYAYFEGLSLSQWFSKMSWSGVQVKKGLASIKVWASWENNEWNKIQTTFQIYSLELYSDVQQRAELIERMSGNVGWRREGDTQIISGAQVFIDFPYHLWPVTNFSVKYTKDSTDDIVLNSLQFNYLNLADTMRVVSLTDNLLSDDLRQKISTLNPRGEIQNLQASAAAPLAMTDINNLDLTAGFSGLTLNPWQTFPGVSNFKGDVKWNKTKGSLKLDGSHVFVTVHQLFHKPLYFEQLAADVAVEKLPQGGWKTAANNIFISNADLELNTRFSVTVPETDSPDVDFSADFKVHNLTHLINYFPEKILDPDLDKWLTGAFSQSKSLEGRALIKGLWKDFPFENNNGQFSVTAKLNDLDLNFAPDWPALNNMMGDITFAGRSMTVNVASGKIASVPVSKIVATIPYIGDDAPQILHVDGTIQTDLQDGLQFIHTSPLQKTVGKDLESMRLIGPMMLKLGLIVPLKHPDKTTVTGVVSITNAGLMLPQWKLAFIKLNGAFQFTEQDISANNMTGELFGAPATLKLYTEKNKTPVKVHADIESIITTQALENWSKVSLSVIVQGDATYEARLLMTPGSGGTQMTLLSDLKGMTVSLPAPYAKSGVAAGTFKLDLSPGTGDMLKVKLNYNKLISAALDLQNTEKEIKLTSAELRLGGGDADFQTSPGLVLTGKLKELDVNKWRDYFTTLRDKMQPAVKVAARTDLTSQLKMLRQVDLSTDLFVIMNQQLHQARIQLSHSDSAWSINIDSKEISGAITLPFNLDKEPVQGNFQHIYLGATQTKKQNLDPGTLPAMNLQSDDTRVGDITLGHVTLEVLPSSRGVQIRQLRIEQPLLNLNAVGEWVGTTGRYNSKLQGEMDSPKVSDLLNEWGLSTSNFIGGKGKVTFNLNWPDAPYALTLKGMTGNFSLDLGEGRIVELSDSSNAKIGLGRMLNIFSLSTLQRRLSLNFKDMTQKGYDFDYMKGDFTLRDGSAFSDNMKINGPIAKVEIQGRVGFAAKDFDIKLSITPYVTGSLPVVAAFAGGPIVGVAALLVDTVISKSMSRIITYHYNVTGPWTNPNWAPSSTPQSVSQPAQQSVKPQSNLQQNRKP